MTYYELQDTKRRYRSSTERLRIPVTQCHKYDTAVLYWYLQTASVRVPSAGFELYSMTALPQCRDATGDENHRTRLGWECGRGTKRFRSDKEEE